MCHQPAIQPTYFYYIYTPTYYPPYVAPPPPPPPPPVLKECSIDARIVDEFSSVVVSQQFYNEASVASEQLTYSFSVLAGAAICDFEMIRANGKKVIGVVKEWEEAQKTLREAITAGHTAALGEETSKDVFSITVGKIGPNETITINITYLQTLVDGDSKYRARPEVAPQLRFTLPRAYLQRAGQEPTGKIRHGVNPTNVPFTMKLSIKQWTKIIDCKTPGYSPRETWSGDEKSLTLEFEKNTSSKDIVVIITAETLGKTRAIVEQRSDNSTAIAMTFVPTWAPSQDSPNMEYIALVDQSSSMTGVKLEMIQNVLKELLDKLPSQGTYFNIFSFGEKVEFMSSLARAYNTTEVWSAKLHIDKMKADYGKEKQISKALSKVFESLPSRLTRPVSIFLMTDGTAWDVQECISKTEAAIRERSTPENYMRVFTVGVGDGVSTEMCDGIARAGRGMATYITTPDQQTVLGQCKRLIDAARTLPVSNFRVVGNQSEPGPQDVGPPPDIQQAPKHVPFLNGTRTSIFAIAPTGVPSVQVQYTLPSGRTFVITFDIYRTTGNFFHTLAAKGLITDREDQYLYSPATRAELKREIVQYGTEYGLASRFTSYVAVDNQVPVGTTIPKRSAMNDRLATRVFTSTPENIPLPQNRSARVPQVRSANFEVVSYSPQLDSSSPTVVSFDLEELEDPGFTSTDVAQQQQLDDATTILSSLSSIQGVDGGFGSKVDEVMELIVPLFPASLMKLLDGYDMDIVAALLAWTWMVMRGGDDAIPMIQRLDKWIRKNADADLDVDAIQLRLYTSSFTD